MVNFKKIDVSKIYLEPKDSKFINIRYNGNPLIFETPDLYVPFGIEQEYQNYVLKTQCKKNKEDSIEFLDFIKDIEKTLKKLLDSDNLKTQIKETEKYDPLILTKLPQNKGKINIEILSDEGDNLNIYTLMKNKSINKKFIECIFIIDSIFIKDDNYYYKIKVKRVILKQICV